MELKKIIYQHFDYIVHRPNMILEIDNKTHKFDLRKCSLKLLNASKVQRDNYEISPSGHGIHWPMIDEDLSIDGLLGIKHTVPSVKKAS